MIFLSVGFSTLDFLWRFKHKNFAFVHFEQSLFASNILCLLRTFLWSFKLSKCCIFLLQAFFVPCKHFSFTLNSRCSLRTFCVRFERFSFASNILIKFQIFKMLFAANIFYSLRTSFIRCEYFSFVMIILCSLWTLFYSIQTFSARFEQKVFVTYIKVFVSCIRVFTCPFFPRWPFVQQFSIRNVLVF